MIIRSLAALAAFVTLAACDQLTGAKTDAAGDAATTAETANTTGKPDGDANKPEAPAQAPAGTTPDKPD